MDFENGLNPNIAVADSEETLDISVEDLFKDPLESQPKPEITSTNPEPEINMTEHMTRRINSVRTKTEAETADRIAREAGYDSYAAMKKAQEEKIAKDNGFEMTDIENVINPIIEKRLEEDPRFKKLQEFEQREREAYFDKALASINAATGQQLKAENLSKETLDLFAKGIDLESAYFATQGKTLFTQSRIQANNGTMAHLASGASSGATAPTVRRLTAEEKALYKSINKNITDEELNKKTIEIK